MPAEIRQRDRRRAILRAAADRIARSNVGGASVRQIATDAHVSPGLVQHYFQTKQNLHRAVDQAVLESLSAHLARSGRELDEHDVRQALGQCLADFIAAEPAFARYVRWALVQAAPEGERVAQALRAFVRSRLDELDTRGMATDGLDYEVIVVQLLLLNLGPLIIRPDLLPENAPAELMDRWQRSMDEVLRPAYAERLRRRRFLGISQEER